MKERIDNNFWLFNIPIAHRGLFNDDYPENSLLAFENAINNGYAIETDVQMTSDGILVCVHDFNLSRVTGNDIDIRKVTYEEVKNLKINGKNTYIPTFEEMLALVDGKVPLVIEIKPAQSKLLPEKFVEILKNYKGQFVVQSFDPFVMRKIQKLEKSFIRGILTTREELKGYPKIVTTLMRAFIFKYIFSFDFVNCRIEDLLVNQKHLKKYKTICWTAQSDEDILIAEKYALNVIFESTVNNLGKFDKRK